MSWLLTMLLAAATPPSGTGPAEAVSRYRCWLGIDLAGLSGALWRDFRPDRPDEYYSIQLYNREASNGPFATWRIDNRPPGRPPRPRAFDPFGLGRPEADAFRLGPDSVHFGTIRHGRVPDGRIWVRLFGDGAYAGVYLAQSARRTRWAHRNGADGLSLFASRRAQPEIFARLADAERWEAVLVDEAGRELGRKSVRVPSAREIQAGFNRARDSLLRHRDAFIEGRSQGPAPVCAEPSDDEEI